MESSLVSPDEIKQVYNHFRYGTSMEDASSVTGRAILPRINEGTVSQGEPPPAAVEHSIHLTEGTIEGFQIPTNDGDSQPSVIQYIEGEYQMVDVLSQRGSRGRNHYGNIMFLLDIAQSLHGNPGTTRAAEVISRVEARRGRFLKLDKKENKWFVMPPKAAVEKVRHYGMAQRA